MIYAFYNNRKTLGLPVSYIIKLIIIIVMVLIICIKLWRYEFNAYCSILCPQGGDDIILCMDIKGNNHLLMSNTV